MLCEDGVSIADTTSASATVRFLLEHPGKIPAVAIEKQEPAEVQSSRLLSKNPARWSA
jgi:hypothetical protein